MSEYPIVRGETRSGHVTYKVIVGDAEVYHEDFDAIGRLVAAAMREVSGVSEVRLSRDGLALFVYVPRDVTIEAIDRKAALVFAEWKAAQTG